MMPCTFAAFDRRAVRVRGRCLGPQVAGVLTGANEDGAAGLEAIHRVGGLTVIQDPAEAAVPTMRAQRSHRTTSCPYVTFTDCCENWSDHARP